MTLWRQWEPYLNSNTHWSRRLPMERYAFWGRKKMPPSPWLGRSRRPDQVGHSSPITRAIDVLPDPLKC
jgi:hypothetical protein